MNYAGIATVVATVGMITFVVIAVKAVRVGRKDLDDYLMGLEKEFPNG